MRSHLSLRFSLMFCLCLIALIAVSCGERTEIAPAAEYSNDSVTVIGVIRDGAADSVSLHAVLHPADVMQETGRTIAAAALYPNRSFELRAWWPREGVLSVYYGNEEILDDVYMRAGDTLTLRKEGDKIIAVSNALYEFQQRFNRTFYTDSEVEEDYRRRFALEPVVFASYVDKRLTDQVAMVRGEYPPDSPDSLFMHYMMNKVEYGWAYDRLQYAWKTSRVNQNLLRPMKGEYYEFLHSVRTDNPEALNSDEYAAFLLGYTEYLYDSLAATKPYKGRLGEIQRIVNEAADRLRLIESHFSPETAEAAKALYLHSEIKTLAYLNNSQDSALYMLDFLEPRRLVLDSLYKAFKLTTTDTNYLNLLENQYQTETAAGELPEM